MNIKTEKEYVPEEWRIKLEIWCDDCGERIVFESITGVRYCSACGKKYKIKVKIVKVTE